MSLLSQGMTLKQVIKLPQSKPQQSLIEPRNRPQTCHKHKPHTVTGSPKRSLLSPRRTRDPHFLSSGSLRRKYPRLGRPLCLGKASLHLGEECQVLDIFLPKQTLNTFHHFNLKISLKLGTKTRLGRILTSWSVDE